MRTIAKPCRHTNSEAFQTTTSVGVDLENNCLYLQHRGGLTL